MRYVGVLYPILIPCGFTSFHLVQHQARDASDVFEKHWSWYSCWMWWVLWEGQLRGGCWGPAASTGL